MNTNDQTDHDGIPNDLMRPREAAKLLGVHLSTVYSWMDTGTLPYYRLAGRQRRISRRDAVAMVRLETAGTARERKEEKVVAAAERMEQARRTLATLKRYGLDKYL